MIEDDLEEAAKSFQIEFELLHLCIYPEATFLLYSDTAVNVCSCFVLTFLYSVYVMLGM